MMQEAVLWSSSSDGSVVCELCPYLCHIKEGGRGICGVRENSEGRLQTLIYGLVSSIAADPIEKKPLFHFYPGSKVLSLGTVGCNMRCIHCQNWEISLAKPEDLPGARFLPPEDLVRMATDSGCRGVAWTYNEPTIWMEYALDSAKSAKEAGLYTAFVTNGYITEAGLDLIGPHMDAYRVDIKGFRSDLYKELAHIKDPTPIFRAAVRAKDKWDMHVEIVTNVIPGMNDSEDELRAIAEWIRHDLGAETPWHVTRFQPHLKLSHLAPTPLDTIARAREIGFESGLSFVYVGNVSSMDGEDTLCPSCDNLVIARKGYSTRVIGLAEGGCSRCGKRLNMVFD